MTSGVSNVLCIGDTSSVIQIELLFLRNMDPEKNYICEQVIRNTQNKLKFERIETKKTHTILVKAIVFMLRSKL